MRESPKPKDECSPPSPGTVVVGDTQGGWRSHPPCVSVSALFDPSVVDLGGELQHVFVPLQRVLVQLNLFEGCDDGIFEEGGNHRHRKAFSHGGI